MGALVITAGDGLESLLACGIPDLQFYRFAVHINSSNLEIHTNCRHEVVIENVILINTKTLVSYIFDYLRQISKEETIFQRLSFR